MTEPTGPREPGRPSDLFAPPAGSPFRLDSAAPPPPPAPPAPPQTRPAPPPSPVGRPAPPPPPGVAGRSMPPPPPDVVGRDAPPPPAGHDGRNEPPARTAVAPAAPMAAVAPEAEPIAGPSRPTRPSLGLILGGLLVVVVLGLGAWGVANRSSAARWRTRGLADRAQLQSQVDAAKAAQATVVRDRTRLAALAAQNANLSDRNTILQDVVKGVPGLSAALERCSAAITAVKPGDLAAVAAADKTCAAAKARAVTLQKVADSLGL